MRCELDLSLHAKNVCLFLCSMFCLYLSLLESLIEYLWFCGIKVSCAKLDIDTEAKQSSLKVMCSDQPVKTFMFTDHPQHWPVTSQVIFWSPGQAGNCVKWSIIYLLNTFFVWWRVRVVAFLHRKDAYFTILKKLVLQLTS